MDAKSTADQYLDEIRDCYEHGPIDSLYKRLASFRGQADNSVIGYLTLLELRAIHKELIRARAHGGAER
jgi:hypothetical protein